MDETELLEFFRRVPILTGLDDASLTLLAQRALQETFPKDATIVAEGSEGSKFFIIAKGTVEISKRAGAAGAEAILARLPAGEFFGEMSILECQPRSATVRALQDAFLLSLKSTDLLTLYRQRPAQYAILILNIARDLARRLRARDEAFATRGACH